MRLLQCRQPECGKADGLPYTLVFRFDEGGNAIGFQLTVSGYGTQAYWYQRNLQGDVVGIYNGSGTLIGRHTYDAWGKLLDIELIAKTAHAFNPDIRVIVDNTFCTPYLQRPLELGANVVVHSATKYLNGHGDVIAGIVIGKADFIGQCRMFGLKDMTGAVMSPFDAFLMARGLKTLDIRMERHCANAKKVAEFFASHPAVDKVYYPGLDSFPGHEIAAKQMKLPGGMISIELKADKAATAAALNKLELCTIAVSLGDAETLVEHPATMTHSTYTAEELKMAGISEGLVRISVGLEDPEDIIDDFKTVLDTL